MAESKVQEVACSQRKDASPGTVFSGKCCGVARNAPSSEIQRA